MTCIEILIRGRVQGVGFRQFTADRAKKHGIVGWVRNESDGSVLVRACGEKSDLEALMREVMMGPSLARVDAFETRTVTEGEGSHSSFDIRF